MHSLVLCSMCCICLVQVEKEEQDEEEKKKKKKRIVDAHNDNQVFLCISDEIHHSYMNLYLTFVTIIDSVLSRIQKK